MFDLDLKHINTDEFRVEALKFEANKRKHGTGFYTDAPKGSIEYKNYWNLQRHYCENGYSVGGVKITGEHYFYLNFCQISLKITKKITDATELIHKKSRVETTVTFPDFWDSDWYYFNECKKAEELGLHMIVLKPRRRGYSYKNAAKCAWTYTFSKTQANSLILAEDKKYSEETMRMAVSYLDFINRYTGFSRQRQHINKPREIVQASFEEITPDGRKLIGGSMSRIMQYSTLNNPDVAHPYSQEVYTPEGKTTWENIVVGSNLFDKNGNITTVTQIYEHGEKEIYEIEFQDGRKVKSTENHLWNICRDGYSNKGIKGYEGKCLKEYTFTTKKLFDITNLPSYSKNKIKIKLNGAVNFNKKEVPIDPYTLGLMLGDGCIVKSGKDSAHITMMKEDFDEVSKLLPYETMTYKWKTNKDHKISIPNAKQLFTELDLIDKRSFNKFVPDIYKYNSKDVRLNILNGLLDTDGSITKDYGVIEYCSKSHQLAKDVSWLAYSLGLGSTIKNKTIKGNVYYRVYIYCKPDTNFLFRLKRKNKRLILKKNNPYALNLSSYTTIKSIKIIGTENSKCVTVSSKDSLYLIGDFIITHNCRGKDARVILFEEAGSMSNLKAAYTVTRPTVESGTAVSGQIFVYGTGGDFTGGMVDFEEMFYDPETYGFLAYDNMYDEGSTTQIGYFLPDSYSKLGFITDQGLSLYKEAETAILAEREHLRRTTKDINIVDKMICENPLKPSEAMLKMGTNIYPKAEINRQISRIKGDKALSTIGITGFMSQDEHGKVMFNPSTDFKPILNFPYKPDVDGEGCVIQYQPPFKMDNYIPKDLYYISVDPFAMDKDKAKEISKRDSLGAAYVMKRINNFSKPYDIIVAEYVARPKFQDDFNRQLFLLAEYYNAKIVFENDRDGNIMSYARTNKLLHRLEEELTVYDSNDNPRRKLGRSYGVSMSNLEVKKQAVQYFRDWLLAPREKNENGEYELNLHKIYSIPLLEEILKFSYDGNFDRHSAMLVAMLYKKELLLKPQLQLKEESVYDDPFFVDLKYKFGLS